MTLKRQRLQPGPFFMSSTPVETAPAAPWAVAHWITALYALTLFLSAFLLFSVQPLFTKMVLPALGGSPGVWSVAMVFFQALLLGGYLWAHALTRLLSLHMAALAHLTLTAAAILTLPIALPEAARTPPDEGQALWLIGVFATAVGLPFFALSANGPLLQAWFARGSGRTGNPYALYGASNAGSFGALLAYPFLLEPFFGLTAQSAVWAWGFLAVLIGLGLCGLTALRDARRMGQTAQDAALSLAGNWTWGRFAKWTALAAIPSALLVSVTAHISTDIAAAPLLWVIPLALYLLTFVVVFRERFVLAEQALAPAQAVATLVMLALMSMPAIPSLVALALQLVFFFLSVTLCHRALYLSRPGHADLTLFYVAMSLGGVLGGFFAGLLAPVLFSSVLEHPMLIAAILFCQPAFIRNLGDASRRELLPPLAAVIAFSAGALLLAPHMGAEVLMSLFAAALAGFGILSRRSAPAIAISALALAAIAVLLPGAMTNASTWRSFFGVHKVIEAKHMGSSFRMLMHGTTMHGAVRIDAQGRPSPADAPRPTTYYAPEGPLGEAIATLRNARGGLPVIHAIGLGIGALACHRKPGEAMVFFEIDTEVIGIARNATLFNFLSACAEGQRIVTGDARLTLARENQAANLIVIDAFSSDAIPVHLITREALDVYLSKLAPDGALVFHISNNMMNLTHVLARAGAEHGLRAWRRVDIVPSHVDADMRASSIAMVLARDDAHVGRLTANPSWRRIEPDMARRSWSDDHSTILEPILDNLR